MNFHFRKFLMLSVCWGAGVTAHASSRVAEENLFNAVVRRDVTYKQACLEAQAMGLDLNRIERFRQFRQPAVENTTTVTPPAQIISAGTVNYNTIQRMTVPSHIMPTSLVARPATSSDIVPRIAPPILAHPSRSLSLAPAPAQFVANQDHDDDLIEAMRQSVIENQVHQQKLEVERKQAEYQGNIRQQEMVRLAQEQQTREEIDRDVALSRQRLERTLQPAESTEDQVLKLSGQKVEKTGLNSINRDQQLENSMRALQIHGHRVHALQPAELTEDQALALAMEESEREEHARRVKQLQDDLQKFTKAELLLQLQRSEQLAREQQVRDDEDYARVLDQEEQMNAGNSNAHAFHKGQNHQSTRPKNFVDRKNYRVMNISGTDNDCGYNAMLYHVHKSNGHGSKSRQQVVDKLLTAVSNEKIRILVSSEIRRSALYDGDFKPTSEIIGSVENYWKHYTEQLNKVQEINHKLGISGLSADEIMTSGLVDVPLRRKLNEIIELQDKAFNDVVIWSRKPEIYKAYIADQIARNHTMLSYYPDIDEFGHKDKTMGVINAIAELFKVRLEIYEYGQNEQYKLVHYYAPTEFTETARLIHQDWHFNFLVKN